MISKRFTYYHRISYEARSEREELFFFLISGFAFGKRLKTALNFESQTPTELVGS